ncbi:hypothetical protein SAMN04487906_2234 [Zhouia amylolytica]|uniref:DKNYY family protein n=1 Tax=Zhouia amylolytica TaxID=376730 RepID=A0A1I6TYE0_9FLAO|nr:hypothetical protein [Zhouia amylolytica]MCQ0111075.1 hypothetical protein [Zhouia amylolytica]SFS94253.1 hypothetical protein SAMN04487906_2234 [Zhouia amylolytica]
MKNLFTICLMLLITFASAQITNNRGASSISDGFTSSQVAAKGSPFFLKSWSKGNVVDQNGKFLDQTQLIYNTYNNQLFFRKNDNEDPKLVDGNTFPGFVLNHDNNTYIFSKISSSEFVDTKQKTKYYCIANPPYRKVIVEYSSDFKDPNASGWQSSRYNNKGGEFDQDTNVFVMNKYDKYEEVKLNKSSVLNFFADKKDEIKKYLKDNNIKLKEPADLVPVVKYYYSL